MSASNERRLWIKLFQVVFRNEFGRQTHPCDVTVNVVDVAFGSLQYGRFLNTKQRFCMTDGAEEEPPPRQLRIPWCVIAKRKTNLSTMIIKICICNYTSSTLLV